MSSLPRCGKGMLLIAIMMTVITQEIHSDCLHDLLLLASDVFYLPTEQGIIFTSLLSS